MRLKPFAISLKGFEIVRDFSSVILYKTGPQDRFHFSLVSEKVIEKLIVAFKLQMLTLMLRGRRFGGNLLCACSSSRSSSRHSPRAFGTGFSELGLKMP